MRTRTNFLHVVAAFVLFWVSASSPAWAATPSLRLPAVISEHAIVQADAPVAIWGQAMPGESVTVTFESREGKPESFETKAADDGKWFGHLPPLKAGTGGRIVVRTASGQTQNVDDVLVGQVWLCGGQSNMSYLVDSQSRNVNERTTPQLLAAAKSEATAAGGAIRYFATRHRDADAPLDDVEGKWIVATPDSVGKCFALSWNFGVALHAKIHQPIGLIDSAVGGTVIEAWTPKPELDACTAGPGVEQRYQERYAKYDPSIKAKFESETARWMSQYPSEKEQAEHLASKPILNPATPNIPARLYNGMIHGLEPYTLKGVIWFQGDGNCYHPADYGVMLKTLITAWRTHFENAHLPFYYVEMQNYRAPQSQPVEPNALSEIREQQQAALELPDTDVATGVDQGVSVPNYEAHFPDKKPLGQRLAGLALDHLFGQPGLVHSPQFKEAKVEGNTMRLKLEYADGLRLRGAEPRGFAIRSASGPWVWAKARIDGKDLVVWSDQVAEPAAVRYAWAYHPLLSIENAAGLPLRPFRTDTTGEH
jgi:sialate O-acetylesterase